MSTSCGNGCLFIVLPRNAPEPFFFWQPQASAALLELGRHLSTGTDASVSAFLRVVDMSCKMDRKSSHSSEFLDAVSRVPGVNASDVRNFVRAYAYDIHAIGPVQCFYLEAPDPFPILTCPGCREGIGNQEGHMGPWGCMGDEL